MNFGELIEPVSRAFWDNYEDVEDNDVYQDPSWTWFTESEDQLIPPNKSHVLIFEGESISEFVTGAILDKIPPLCQLKESASCSVYDLPETPFLVVVSQEKDLHLFNLITELLEPFIGPGVEKITTISVLSSVQHKRTEESLEDDPVCYMRSHNGTVSNIRALESPNILTGVVAGVSLWRQWKDLPQANNYIAYMEGVVYDSATTKPLIDLLKRLDVPCVASFHKRFHDESNLYM